MCLYTGSSVAQWLSHFTLTQGSQVQIPLRATLLMVEAYVGKSLNAIVPTKRRWQEIFWGWILFFQYYVPTYMPMSALWHFAKGGFFLYCFLKFEDGFNLGKFDVPPLYAGIYLRIF